MAKIMVVDCVPGSVERVNNYVQFCDKCFGETGILRESLRLHCAAKDALLKVHFRIVEEDLFGGATFDDNNYNNFVTARFLVPNDMVGCLLGRRRDVIQRLRSETGASIRVLPAEHRPTCAMATDELVQVNFSFVC